MTKIDIIGKNKFESWSKERTACRGILLRDNKILVTYETKNDGQLMIPGGGLEENESLADCCAREIAEETGYIVSPREPLLEIDEFYEEYRFISYYFICEITGETSVNLTSREQSVGMEMRWLPIDEVIKTFSTYDSYSDIDEMRRGLYFREYNALSALTGYLNNKELSK